MEHAAVSPHLYILSYKCSVAQHLAVSPHPYTLSYKCSGTWHWLFPHTCTYCHTHSVLLATLAVSPHLYMLLYIQVQCYLPHWMFPHTCTYCCTYKCSVTCLSGCFPTPVHAVVHTSAVTWHSSYFRTPVHAVVHTSAVLPASLAVSHPSTVTWHSSCFPTPVHDVVHTSAMVPASLPVSPHLYMLLYIQVQCYLPHWMFPHTCTYCCTYKCSVTCLTGCFPTPVHAVVHPSAVTWHSSYFRTPVHAVVHTSAVLPASLAISAHLCMLLYIQVQLPDTLAISAHLYMLLYIQVQCYLPLWLFPHTCTCCCKYKCSVTDGLPVCPHLYMLLYTSKCSVIWQSACLPTPVHAVVYIQVQCYLTVRLFAHTCTCCCIHPSAVSSDSPPVCPHLYMLLYTSKCSVIWQSACLPTPVHAVVYIQVQCYLTVRLFAHTCTCCCIHPSAVLSDGPPVCPHLYMLL